MADFITPPKIKIVGSSEPGKSDVTVTYEVIFDSYDEASNQGYIEVIKLIGEDHNPGEDLTNDELMTMVKPHPDHPSPTSCAQA